MRCVVEPLAMFVVPGSDYGKLDEEILSPNSSGFSIFLQTGDMSL